MLTDKELKTLQDIVSSRWVFTSPCMMDTYSFYMNPETLNKEGGRWTPRPVAVVLPQKTEEIQEIMIQRMHSQLIENIGEIGEEMTKVL